MNDKLFAIRFVVRQWQCVDATMDNSGSIAAEDADMQTVEACARVRQAGYDAAAQVEARGELGWPPLEHDLVVPVDRADWDFVLDQIAHWDAVSAEMYGADTDDETAIEERASSQEVRAVITAALAT